MNEKFKALMEKKRKERDLIKPELHIPIKMRKTYHRKTNYPKRISLRLSENIFTNLITYCKSNHIDSSSYVRSLIKQGLFKKDEKRIN